jgi:(p)ppGpp synthase/HD superfamily hydrolase
MPGKCAKGTDKPYITRLVALASLVLERGGGEDEVIAALLHDTVEDCRGEAQAKRIAAIFGNNVAQLVLECSDCISSDPDEQSDWLERNRSYIAAVPIKSASARLVTACDKLHNATVIWRIIARLKPRVESRCGAGLGASQRRKSSPIILRCSLCCAEGCLPHWRID